MNDDGGILLDVQCRARFLFTQHLRWGGEMASDTDDPETAAERLEAALERIAQAAAREEARPADQILAVDTEEIAARLDGLIDRLRAALGDVAG